MLILTRIDLRKRRLTGYVLESDIIQATHGGACVSTYQYLE
jgi:hypothetical protein